MHKLYSYVNKNDYLNYLNLYFLQTFSFHSSVTCISERPRLLDKLFIKVHKFVDIGNLKNVSKNSIIFEVFHQRLKMNIFEIGKCKMNISRKKSIIISNLHIRKVK